MADPAHLKLPLGFEKREDVRLFARMFKAQDQSFDTALHCALLLWMEFAAQGREWRPFRSNMKEAVLSTKPMEEVFEREELALLIEDFCGWEGSPGMMVKSAVAAGLLRMEFRGDLGGLVLNDFAEYNAHLLPGYRTMQQKGSAAATESKQRKNEKTMARQQREILVTQSLLNFEGEQPTENEVTDALALIMRVDRTIGHPARLTSEFSQSLVNDALRVLRTFTPDEIDSALESIYENRAKPGMIRPTAHLLADFNNYVPRGAR